MANEIDISGVDKAELLAGLYNRSKPQGFGFVHFDKNPMTREQAQEILKTDQSFDYLQGRVMKIDIGGDTMNPWGFDRDNGKGAAQSVVDAVKTKTTPPTRDASGDVKEASRMVIEADSITGDKVLGDAIARNIRGGFLNEILDNGSKDPKVKSVSGDLPPR